MTRSEEYEIFKKALGLEKNMPKEEIDIIDNIQFDFLRYECLLKKKSVRLPNFGIFLLKTRYRDGESS